MKQGIITEIDWQYIGAVLANEGDDVQTKFFKAFVKECFSWNTNAQAEFQLAAVNHRLTEDEKELLSMLGYKED